MKKLVVVLALLLKISLKSYVQSQSNNINYCDYNPPVCGHDGPETRCALLRQCCSSSTLRLSLSSKMITRLPLPLLPPTLVLSPPPSPIPLPLPPLSSPFCPFPGLLLSFFLFFIACVGIDVLLDGFSINADCTAGGNAIEWSLDNIPLATSTVAGSRFQVDGSSLMIRNITGDYEGIYQCFDRDAVVTPTPIRCVITLGKSILDVCCCFNHK